MIQHQRASLAFQFPVTSNYGSMKKRSQRSATNTNSTTVLSSAGEPSPSASEEAAAALHGGDPSAAAAMAAISLRLVCSLFRQTEHQPILAFLVSRGRGPNQEIAGQLQPNLKLLFSVDNVHRYVPEYLAISNRKTAV